MKIVHFAYMAFQYEPDLLVIDDEIVYESLSDDTLNILHQFIFNEHHDYSVDFEQNVDHNDMAVASTTDCAITIEPLIEFYLNQKFFSEIFSPTSGIGGFLVNQEININNFGIALNINGDLVVKLPENDGKRISYIISKAKWNEMMGYLYPDLSDNRMVQTYDGNRLNVDGISVDTFGERTIDSLVKEFDGMSFGLSIPDIDDAFMADLFPNGWDDSLTFNVKDLLTDLFPSDWDESLTFNVKDLLDYISMNLPKHGDI